jgi:23S rRNA (guanine2445-N2)-methyltransferase / 23S rRNA (guanine2069-N7)-methyltransferase
MNTQQPFKLFATCPKSLEQLLANELETIGAKDIKLTVAGVHFSGDLKTAYEVCLWSRMASRVLLELSEFPCHSNDELYNGVYEMPWTETFAVNKTFVISASLRKAYTDHTVFASQKVKDAIVDKFRDVTQSRPSVDKDKPDLRFNLFCDEHKATIYLDLGGTSLHQRGYRSGTGVAPLKENLAAALLVRAGWPEMAKQNGTLLDPMCGSATLLIEGAFIARDQAPGLTRKRWGFSSWKNHNSELWDEVVAEAQQRLETGKTTYQGELFGFDKSGRVLDLSEDNIRRSGCSDIITLKKASLEKNQFEADSQTLVIVNPPYGERLDDRFEALSTYGELGDWLKTHALGAKLAVLALDKDMARATGIKSQKFYKLFNGPIPVELCCSEVAEENFSTSPYSNQLPELTPGAEALSNRIKKNQKKLSKWLRREEIDCYRLYDADLPEYNVAIDCYKNFKSAEMFFHLQEYAAPAELPEAVARKRLDEALLVLRHIFQVGLENISIKQRRIQKKTNQYQKQELLSENKSAPFVVKESGLKFEVNLGQYLDSGLFLDHRPVRKLIAEKSKAKNFLNLFAYTGSASVYAAAAGASSTTTIDMSNTYLDWARRNMSLNGFIYGSHHFLKEDCLKWVETNNQKFDLIFLDPPTFSNSKNMYEHWDVQEDHEKLINQVMNFLEEDGELIFSTNMKKFKISEQLSSRFEVKNITAQTIDQDFQRRSNIHHCFIIKHQ